MIHTSCVSRNSDPPETGDHAATALSWRSHNLTTSNSACVRASATVLEDVDDPAVRDADGDLAAKPGSGAWPKPGSDAKASWVPIIRHWGKQGHGSGTIYA